MPNMLRDSQKPQDIAMSSLTMHYAKLYPLFAFLLTW